MHAMMVRLVLALFRRTFGISLQDWTRSQAEEMASVCNEHVIAMYREGLAEGRCRTIFGNTWPEPEKMIICRQHADTFLREYGEEFAIGSIGDQDSES
jgi:hypothetical protein